jgi:glyoxylase-like metal-dependent hydrolase (beta-lactamase superfamily II)
VSRPTAPSVADRLSRRGFLRAGSQAIRVAGAAALAGGLMRAYPAGRAQVSPTISAIDLGGLTLLEGAGCNVIAMRGEDGALMVDGGLAVHSDRLLRAVTEVTGNAGVHTLINTHWHPEQTGSNEAVGRDGGVIIAHEKTRMYLSNAVTSTTFEGRYGPLRETGWPGRTTYDRDSLEFAGQRVDCGYLPAAHTDGDLYVHFPAINLLVAGGPVSADRWPLLDYRNGAWMGGRVRALETLAELVAPDTRVVGSHGRMLTGSDIVRHRDINQELYFNLMDLLNMGMGPEDVVERNPLRQHQAEFGDPSSCLYGAYRSLLLAYVPD